jgi:hypothetical protein
MLKITTEKKIIKNLLMEVYQTFMTFCLYDVSVVIVINMYNEKSKIVQDLAIKMLW